jgi:hypothetical protein
MAEFLVDRCHIGLRHATEFPTDHRPFDGPQDPGRQGREKQPSTLPIGYQMIPEKTAPDVTGDSCYNDFLP